MLLAFGLREQARSHIEMHSPVGASLLAIRWRSQRPFTVYCGINAPGT